MRLETVKEVLNARVLCEGEGLDTEVLSACGCDLMSYVLAFVKNQAMLLTGLVNLQVVRTAEMMDMVCIVFVRNKMPTDAMLELAKSHKMVVMTTALRMYDACGKLYKAGLGNGDAE